MHAMTRATGVPQADSCRYGESGKRREAAGTRRLRQRRGPPRDYWGNLIFGTMNWLPGARITSHCASPLRAWPAWFTNSMLPTTL